MGSLYVFISACLWGASGIFVRLLSQIGLSGSQLVFTRLSFQIAILFVGLFYFDRQALKITKKDLVNYLLAGSVGIFGMELFYTLAIQKVGMAVASVLCYVSPAMVLVFSVLFLKEQLNIKKVLSVIFSICACGLVSGIMSGKISSVIGVVYGLLSAVCYSVYTLTISIKLADKKVLTNVFYTFVFAWMMSFLSLFVKGFDNLGQIICTDWIQIFLYAGIAGGIGCSILPYLFYNIGAKMIPVTKVSIIASFEPVAAVIFGIIVFHEQISIYGYIGVILEICALLLIVSG